MVIGYRKYDLRSWGYTSVCQRVAKGKLKSRKHAIWCKTSNSPWVPMAEIMPWIPLVQTQPDAMGMSTAMGSPGQDSLPPQWDPPQPLNPSPTGLRNLTITRRHFPPSRTYNLKCLLKMGPFLTSWEGLAFSDVGGGRFF